MAISLNVLLSHAVLDITRAAEQIAPDMNVVQWSDFLRVADGTARKTLHLETRISKRAIKTYVDRGVATGSVTADDGLVHLTASGRARRDAWGAAVDEACRGWEARHGDALRDALQPVVDALELELSHYIHPYGAADPSITGGGAAGARYGADWKPVPRADPTSGLSILALLSQALVAFTIAYEAQERGPLLWAVNLQSCFADPTPIGDVPAALSIIGNGRSTVERHGFVSVSGGLAHLTGRGQVVKGSYDTLVAQLEAGWRSQHGDALWTALRDVDASLTEQHADHPWVTHAVGTGFIEATRPAARPGS